MRHKKGAVLIWTGILMLAAALGLTCWNIREAKRAESGANQVLEQLIPMVPTRPAEEKQLEETEPPVHPDEVEIPDFLLNPKMDMPEVEIDGRAYIGILEIPALDLSLPVISQWSMDDLRVAPCRYEGSAYRGNMIIAAHNYIGFFAQIRNLEPGDAVRFTDTDGNLFLYQVVERETLMPTDVEKLSAGDWDLTLFTCTVGGSYRVTIRCELIAQNGAYPNQELLQ